MKEVIVITGSSGNLAGFLCDYLSKEYEVRCLTTKKKLVDKVSNFFWDVEKEYIDIDVFDNCIYIIHLAGYSILNRWTQKNKIEMYNSRVKSTQLLFDVCNNINIKPQAFICASASGIYKSSSQRINEGSPKGDDWLARMAVDWENTANKFNQLGSRVVNMRISLIFSVKGGFLKYNLLGMKYGVGAILGDSRRNINWMHIEDISRFTIESLKNKSFIGPYNLAVDESVSQKGFLKLIRKYLFPYALIIKIPAFFVRLILGQRSQIILTDINLDTKKIKESGFKLKFPDLRSMIDDISD